MRRLWPHVVPMKNRFVGLITVTFPDGYVEKCIIKAKAAKGSGNFVAAISGVTKTILKQVPKGHVKVTYRGDLAPEINEALQGVRLLVKKCKVEMGK
jgi:hypothetical protein